jgi:cytochrome c556
MIAPRPARILLAAALAIIVPALAMTGPLAAAPAPAPTGKAAVAARQAGYKKMGAAMKALNDQLKTDAPAKPVILDAARTVAVTAREQPRLFPAGSGASAGVPTDALPAIWTSRADFDAKMADLLTESAKLQTVAATGDIAAIRVQAKATGGTCAACHRAYRADN